MQGEREEGELEEGEEPELREEDRNSSGVGGAGVNGSGGGGDRNGSGSASNLTSGGGRTGGEVSVKTGSAPATKLSFKRKVPTVAPIPNVNVLNGDSHASASVGAGSTGGGGGMSRIPLPFKTVRKDTGGSLGGSVAGAEASSSLDPPDRHGGDRRGREGYRERERDRDRDSYYERPRGNLDADHWEPSKRSRSPPSPSHSRSRSRSRSRSVSRDKSYSYRSSRRKLSPRGSSTSPRSQSSRSRSRSYVTTSRSPERSKVGVNDSTADGGGGVGGSRIDRGEYDGYRKKDRLDAGAERDADGGYTPPRRRERDEWVSDRGRERDSYRSGGREYGYRERDRDRDRDWDRRRDYDDREGRDRGRDHWSRDKDRERETERDRPRPSGSGFLPSGPSSNTMMSYPPAMPADHPLHPKVMARGDPTPPLGPVPPSQHSSTTTQVPSVSSSFASLPLRPGAGLPSKPNFAPLPPLSHTDTNSRPVPPLPNQRSVQPAPFGHAGGGAPLHPHLSAGPSSFVPSRQSSAPGTVPGTPQREPKVMNRNWTSPLWDEPVLYEGDQEYMRKLEVAARREEEDRVKKKRKFADGEEGMEEEPYNPLKPPPTRNQNGMDAKNVKPEEEGLVEVKAMRDRLRERRYIGTSDIQEYQLLNKLGEGTFGIVWKGIRKPRRSPSGDGRREKEEVEGADGDASPKAKGKKRSRGKVKKREEVKEGTVVALKQIIMHNESDGMPITALREIRILKNLDHINVVPVVDIAFERGDRAKLKRGSVYMVFPYMEHDLAGLLDNSSIKFTMSQIKLYAKQLLQGTCYLHKNKILHRDMKAANLLISNDGYLKIADFGLARSIEDYSKGREYTQCVVTRWYRPPELLLGDARYGTPVDMWGVGCIIGEMLRCRPILQGTSDLDQLQRIFTLCGSPDDSSMPGWDQLPGCEGRRTFPPSERRVKSEFKAHGAELCDLLDKLLRLDPRRRLSAEAALDHEWLWTNPRPLEPSQIPRYPDSHEYDGRKRHEANQQPPQQQQMQQPQPFVNGRPPQQHHHAHPGRGPVPVGQPMPGFMPNGKPFQPPFPPQPQPGMPNGYYHQPQPQPLGRLPPPGVPPHASTFIAPNQVPGLPPRPAPSIAGRSAWSDDPAPPPPPPETRFLPGAPSMRVGPGPMNGPPGRFVPGPPGPHQRPGFAPGPGMPPPAGMNGMHAHPSSAFPPRGPWADAPRGGRPTGRPDGQAHGNGNEELPY